MPLCAMITAAQPVRAAAPSAVEPYVLDDSAAASLSERMGGWVISFMVFTPLNSGQNILPIRGKQRFLFTVWGQIGLIACKDRRFSV